MSNPFAIAQVTATLSWILAQAATADLSGFASVTVTNLRPEDIVRKQAAINVFLYLVTPSAAGRNADAPTRRADGTLLKKPRAALDLHYLLSFAGDETRFEPQVLLASAVRTLHATPVLDRATIESALSPPPVGSADFLRTANSDTDLDAAPDLVRLTQTALSLEELSKLWSSLVPQTSYLLSVAYQASVVFLDGEGTPREPAPRARTPVVLATPLPEITWARAADTVTVTITPAVAAAQDVILLLQQVDGPMAYRLPPAARTDLDEELAFTLPAAVVAGTYTLRAVVDGVESPCADARLVLP